MEICISLNQLLACVPFKKMGSKEVVMTSILSQLKILAKNSINCPTNTCLSKKARLKKPTKTRMAA